MATVEYINKNEYQKYERRSVIMSPKKNRPVFTTNLMSSPPIKDSRLFPWNWGESAGEIQLSPNESLNSSVGESSGEKGGLKDCSNDNASDCGQNGADLRRGRPRLDAISSLIMEGTTSHSPIRCQVCNRVFPREKSLQAHLRTHTGERPYICDYPECGRPFAQSGQLKTHQRLHTGEKPFKCSENGCYNRFTHANRHCPKHPSSPLLRDEKFYNSSTSNNENQSEAVTQWLEKYYAEKCDRATIKLREKKLKREFDDQETKEAVKRVKTICQNPAVTVESMPECYSKTQIESAEEYIPFHNATYVKENNDELMGALGLIELGAVCTVTTENCVEETYQATCPLDLSSSSFN